MGDKTGAPRRPVLLIILDGFGANPSKINNGIAEADTPRFDHYFATNPHTLVEASGRAAGLPTGQMGNSEVGHITLGCGAIIRQDLVKIDDAIRDGSLYRNPALCQALERARDQGGAVHLTGLVSDGGVHSHVNHLVALVGMCGRQGVEPLVHLITDGRDTPPRSARDWLPELEQALAAAKGRILSVSGRYYAMDRDHRWERIELAWRALVQGRGQSAASAQDAIEQAYTRGEDDEFILPTLIGTHRPIRPQDQVIFFNFRKDRPKQMISALIQDDFQPFDRGAEFRPIRPTCMTCYDESFGLPYAFEREEPDITLGQYLADRGLKQFRCAETEKFAHVTYFFNGGRADPYPGEDRQIVPSPKVATYDLQPEMSAAEVADQVIQAIGTGQYAFILVNFANGDMVGHTAVREAVIKAVETLDREVSRVLDAAVAAGYSVVLTADHGNCDELVDSVTGTPHTQHTVYPVPCLVLDERPWRLATGGGIKNIAPTVLQLMGLPQPEQMPSESLLLSSLKMSEY